MQDFSSLANLRQLRFFRLITSKPVAIGFISRLNRLEHLWIDGKPEDLDPIAQNHRLATLFLQRMRIDSLSCLQDLPKLATIGVDAASFRCLPDSLNIKPLRRLRLTDNRGLEDFSFLSDFTSLCALDISSGRIKEVPDLSALHNLKDLVCNYLPHVASILKIATAPSIERLELRQINPRLSGDGFQFLTRMPHLKRLYSGAPLYA
jgi:Leucine-rich repeat (LRR) protein